MEGGEWVTQRMKWGETERGLEVCLPVFGFFVCFIVLLYIVQAILELAM